MSFQKIEPETEVIEKKDRDYKPHGIISRQQIKPPNEKFSRRSKRFSGQDEKTEPGIKQEDCKEECDSDPECMDILEKDKENSKELKKLQFYGAGPKMAGFVSKEVKSKGNKTRGVKLSYEFDPVGCNEKTDLVKNPYVETNDLIMPSSWRNTFVAIAPVAITRRACCSAMGATTVTTHFA